MVIKKMTSQANIITITTEVGMEADTKDMVDTMDIIMVDELAVLIMPLLKSISWKNYCQNCNSHNYKSNGGGGQGRGNGNINHNKKWSR